jgi:hypothetical protein
MESSNIFTIMIELLQGLARFSSMIWEWLTTSVSVGQIKIFGFTIFNGITFTPLNALLGAGGVILGIFVVFAIIKTIPGG